jgi:hypothetical protein
MAKKWGCLNCQRWGCWAILLIPLGLILLLWERWRDKESPEIIGPWSVKFLAGRRMY